MLRMDGLPAFQCAASQLPAIRKRSGTLIGDGPYQAFAKFLDFCPAFASRHMVVDDSECLHKRIHISRSDIAPAACF